MIRNALAALSMLIAIATNSYADLENLNPISAILNGGDKVINKLKEQTEFNQRVAETFTIEEYAEWLKVRQTFQAKESKEKEQQLSCVASGTNPKTCVDPHWCLYPDKLNKDECVWYKIKYNIE